jgi:beta-galactosidase GanA
VRQEMQRSQYPQRRGRRLALAVALGLLGPLVAPVLALDSSEPPRVITKDGHHALIVDGEPFLMLAAQANNSSNYPAALPKVWPAVEYIHANTLEMPVAWEQVEPQEGQFDFSFVDTLLTQAREHDLRLVLLWFATWKNNSPKYAPEWVKLDNRRFPRVVTKDGQQRDSLSPVFPATLDADRKAFVALMQHLADVDAQHTVIMVQVENETGTYGSVRDYSPAAERLFRGPVPQELVKRLGRAAGTWSEVFGPDADELFHAWSIGRFVGQVAAAGKAVHPVPMYANAALRDPIKPQAPITYSSGGPTDNVLDVWKVAAPSLDLLAPDIYMREHVKAMAVLDHYARPDNPLFVPEIGNDLPYARYLFPVLGRGGIGFAPFGVDYTGYANYPLGAKEVTEETLAPFARVFRLFAPMAREWARLALDGEVWGVARPDDGMSQTLDLGKWKATVEYGQWQFGMEAWFPDADKPEQAALPVGGAAIARLGPDELLVVGQDARVSLDLARPKTGEHAMLARVEEGHYEQGRWVVERVWSGDQSDYGLNFTSLPQVLRVKLAEY